MAMISPWLVATSGQSVREPHPTERQYSQAWLPHPSLGGRPWRAADTSFCRACGGLDPAIECTLTGEQKNRQGQRSLPV